MGSRAACWAAPLRLFSATLRKSTMPTSILTVGYGNRSLQDVVDVLQRERVQFLIDVRPTPLSRFKPQFSNAPESRTG